KVGLASGDKNFRPVYSIYVAVGQKNPNIVRTMAALELAGALEFTIIVAAPAADNPANQYLAPFSGAAMGEWFMENGMDALIVYDDLSIWRVGSAAQKQGTKQDGGKLQS